jgi:enterochelin esterase-like enzyme
MKKIIFIIGLITVIMTFSSCEDDLIDLNVQETNQVSQKNEKIIHKSKLQNKEFISESLMNNVIGNDPIRKMQVYTPPGYDKKRAEGYPVVYLLHGEPFSEKAFIDKKAWDEFAASQSILSPERDDPSDGFRLWVDNLIETGKMEPMIIVMPNGRSYPYDISMYTNSILNGNFEDYIVYDLVNFMDKRYNTIASNEGRAVIGYSQGGYAAFLFGMKHPDIFGAVASHSGLLLVDTVLSMGEMVMAENPNGFTGPDPAKFLTSAGYAFSAVWSPNLNNPPFYVDLPFEWPSPIPIPEVSERWHQHDIYTMLDTDMYSENFKLLKGIYFDVGIYDELGTGMLYLDLIERLNEKGINYTFETFEGGHFNKTFSRLAVSLKFCSDVLN